jgi:hypothetical protein
MKKITPILIVSILVLSGLGVGASYVPKLSSRQSVIFDAYDMVIITPQQFSTILQPFITHKTSVGVNTFLKTIEEIYNEYSGRDEAEKIKYFIYDSSENFGIKYVLLIGDVYTTPIRKTEVNHIWTTSNIIQVDDVITDLYYADIYDSEGNFSNWDSNNNSVFSEFYLYNFGDEPEEIEIIDEVDLYPDIGVGRIPCETSEELEIVLNKIIMYETQSFDAWFHKIILAAQDGAPEPGSQGEIIADLIADILTDFTPVKLYESKNNLNAFSINREINQGSGFFVCCAHGRHMAFANYHKLFIKRLNNGYKLPVIVMGGCLNAQLDASLHELLKEFGLDKLDNLLQFLHINTKKLLSSIAWDFLRREGGGGIASIGMTRKGTLLHNDPFGGFVVLWAVKLFESYEPGITISDMYNNAITSFIDESWKDYVTLQMFILLGDPSLSIGGYR